MTRDEATAAIEGYFRGRGYASSTWGRQIDLVRDGGVEDAAAMIVKVAVAAGLVDHEDECAHDNWTIVTLADPVGGVVHETCERCGTLTKVRERHNADDPTNKVVDIRPGGV